MGSELALIGLEVAGMLQGLYLEGLSTGLFRPMDPDRAISLIGQQIYGAMSVRAGELVPLPRADAAAEVTEVRAARVCRQVSVSRQGSIGRSRECRLAVSAPGGHPRHRRCQDRRPWDGLGRQ